MRINLMNNLQYVGMSMTENSVSNGGQFAKQSRGAEEENEKKNAWERASEREKRNIEIAPRSISSHSNKIWF